MYPLWLADDLKLTSRISDTMPHFNLEFTQPSKLEFKYPTAGANGPSKQFLKRLPHGFIHNKTMYLFDDHFGCVFIFDWNRPNLKDQYDKKQDRVADRVNQPYEQFFKCPGEYAANPKLDSDRCNQADPSKTNGSGTPTLKVSPTAFVSTIFCSFHSPSFTDVNHLRLCWRGHPHHTIGGDLLLLL